VTARETTSVTASSGTASSGTAVWLDLSAGVAGDMLLGALLDAGASLDAVRSAVEAVVPGLVSIELSACQRSGLRASRAVVSSVAEDHPHRSWATIRGLLTAASGLNAEVWRCATSVFAHLAEAEGEVHGIPADAVEFHEVGSWDSIADVVGVCAALVDLVGEVSPSTVRAGAIALGSGSVRAAHGRLPVPAPAVLSLVARSGWPVRTGGAESDLGELATPTGVALVTTLAGVAAVLPTGRVVQVGMGAGSRERADRANVVRAIVGRFGHAADGPAGSGPAAESLLVLETNVDDLDPRVWPTVLEALLDVGAADAWLTPILMKKGRPAHTVHALASLEAADAVREVFFAHTSTLGVREYAVARHVLARSWVPVVVDGETVRIKVGSRAGRIVQATVEFEDARAAARRLGRPVREVLTAAEAAAAAAGLAPGLSVQPDEERAAGATGPPQG
jgi:uncharacterized protein (TIGR00299 family) protein